MIKTQIQFPLTHLFLIRLRFLANRRPTDMSLSLLAYSATTLTLNILFLMRMLSNHHLFIIRRRLKLFNDFSNKFIFLLTFIERCKLFEKRIIFLIPSYFIILACFLYHLQYFYLCIRFYYFLFYLYKLLRIFIF